ncbi:hypothetical protein [Amycolatopsis keratiniphila]|uniref:Uncharacterized protein n=1 Tax=Amycolatopsis keratiniphila subsp. keratiniphila TaxID=227715 RepID=A0A1W2M0B0_9PSEU|nr:hypothetical protein [Amycolatopsis keratiniphila]OLZ49843.1 hypothetical protein BS330_31460 [Amycolatopsis keratiniphila subsp. nogabecina]ONF73094.1 hypothetical protein AVR91_0207420 [Amycolatopsis keratiniphila subsp. keratiniphila]
MRPPITRVTSLITRVTPSLTPHQWVTHASSPFSTSGALVVANAPAGQNDKVFRGLMIWGFSMCAIAPIATWLLFILPG